MNTKLVKSQDIRNAIATGQREILFKFLVLGDYGVGKTSIIKRYAEGTFSSNYKITIGAEFALKRINWDRNTKVNLQLWDIAGHERFGSLTRVYYKYAVAAAVVFDLSRVETFKSIEKWLIDLRAKVCLPNGAPLPVVLLANKCDVAMSSVPTDDIHILCQKYNILAWYLSSAKENANIDEAIRFLLQKVMDHRDNESSDSNGNIILNDMKIETKAKQFFCCG